MACKDTCAKMNMCICMCIRYNASICIYIYIYTYIICICVYMYICTWCLDELGWQSRYNRDSVLPASFWSRAQQDMILEKDRPNSREGCCTSPAQATEDPLGTL